MLSKEKGTTITLIKDLILLVPDSGKIHTFAELEIVSLFITNRKSQKGILRLIISQLNLS